MSFQHNGLGEVMIAYMFLPSGSSEGLLRFLGFDSYLKLLLHEDNELHRATYSSDEKEMLHTLLMEKQSSKGFHPSLFSFDSDISTIL